MGINEALIIISLILIYGGVLLFYRLFGKEGMYGFTVLATIAANIEVLILVKAFGLEMTLGNVLFASTFLITDILNENEGKKAADKGVLIGIAASAIFIVLSLFWTWYQPTEASASGEAFKLIFAQTPRMIIAGISVYALVELMNVRLYRKIWQLTERQHGSKSLLWLRNNGAGIISQFINSLCFNILAFAGTYPLKTLISIILTTFIIYVCLIALETPFLYVARHIKAKENLRSN